MTMGSSGSRTISLGPGVRCPQPEPHQLPLFQPPVWAGALRLWGRGCALAGRLRSEHAEGRGGVAVGTVGYADLGDLGNARVSEFTLVRPGEARAYSKAAG